MLYFSGIIERISNEGKTTPREYIDAVLGKYPFFLLCDAETVGIVQVKPLMSPQAYLVFRL